MTERMVKVQNMVNKTIVIRKPEYNLNRRWTQKNQIIPIPFDKRLMVEVSSAVAFGAVETGVARIKEFNLEKYREKLASMI